MFVYEGCPSRIFDPTKVVSPPWFPAVGNLSQMYIHTCLKSTPSLTRYLFISFCRFWLFVVVGAYPINILSDIFFSMCVFTRRSYAHFSLVQLLLTILSLYQVDVQTKHARNEKQINSTKRNNIKRRIRAIYYWYCNTRSSPADVKQNTHSRVYHRKNRNFSNYLPFGNDANFGNYPDPQTLL